MTYAELFAGIGGWSVGLRACGWDLKWQCEQDEFCCAVLRKHFGVPIAPDIKTLPAWIKKQFGSIRAAQVDALVGSPPCPPFSVAGKKLGTADVRHLYPAFLDAVRLLRPRYVLMEQVAGLLHDRRAFGEYVGPLAALGYCVCWHSIPACAVGADHQRDRLWFIAHLDREPRRRGRSIGRQQAGPQITSDIASSICRPSPESERPGRIGASIDSTTANAGSQGLQTPGQCREAENTPASQHVLPTVACFPGREAYPELLREVHGVCGRMDRIKSLGNAICPRIAFEIGQAINHLESEK